MKLFSKMELHMLGRYCLIISLVLQQFSVGLAQVDHGSVDSDDRYTSGKAKYEAIKRDTRMPKYGACWTMALEKLESGCKHLDDDLQHYLALLFTNCFLTKTGRQTYPCDVTQEVSECTKDMSSEAYNTYTEFFTHTQNICFFLQAQVWQELTENTIHHLRDSSDIVAKQLEDSTNAQTELIKQQNKSIENQETLLKNGDRLQKTITDSTMDVNRMLLEFKTSTNEQRQLIFEVFDKVSVLQNVVMGEFTGFYSLIFYAIAILISYLLTSTPRTSGARFWLFVLMTCNMVVERLTVFWGVADGTLDGSGHILDENTLLYYRLSLCRKMFTLVAVLVWVWFAYKFQDINKVNNVLLMEIRKQNSELKHLLQREAEAHNETSQIDGTPAKLLPSPSASNTSLATVISPNNSHYSRPNSQLASISNTINKTADLFPSLENSMHEYSISKVDSEGYDSDSDFESDSSDSVLTDRTFTADNQESESDASFMTSSSRHSRESTPALWDELRFLRDCTPMREMTPIKGVTVADVSSYSNNASLDTSSTSSVASPRRGRGRPKGSRRSAPSPMSPAPNRYNLRSRRGIMHLMENPIVEEESAEDFGKTVKHLAQVALRNRVKVAATVCRNVGGGRRSMPGGSSTPTHTFFSSDDE